MAFHSSKLKWGVAGIFLVLVALVVTWLAVSTRSLGRDRVNLLILGKSGVGHAGPDLTDTMIFASISLKSPSVALVSIPRDIWIPEIRAKINSAYFWGGAALVKSLVEKITGQAVSDNLVLDFSGFKEIIDAVGGIEVNVDRAFTDTRYPLAGRENDLCGGEEGTSASRKEFKCRYETIHFEAGLVKMNGETALKFVRSRNGDNGENTDLAREARQQKVITAIKNKALSFGSLVNLGRDLKVYRALKDSIKTDIDKKTGVVLLFRLFSARNNIKSYVFPAELLENPPISPRYDNQYVFVPKAEDWSEVQRWINDTLP